MEELIGRFPLCVAIRRNCVSWNTGKAPDLTGLAGCNS